MKHSNSDLAKLLTDAYKVPLLLAAPSGKLYSANLGGGSKSADSRGN